jgi:hypothetical protein
MQQQSDDSFGLSEQIVSDGTVIADCRQIEEEKEIDELDREGIGI